MRHLSIFEFDALVADDRGGAGHDGLRVVPRAVFDWLESQGLRQSESGGAAWVRPIHRKGRRAVQVTSYVGVIRAPDGFQIEVLPKIGKVMDGGIETARRRLIEMLCCLRGFRHVRTEHAAIKAAHMPILEIFLSEFLDAAEHAVKRGLRGDYSERSGNLSALRGKLSFAGHIRQNMTRKDRFFVEYDEFTPDRPENRLLHAALRKALELTSMQELQKRARELCSMFAGIPISCHHDIDFSLVRRDRGMEHYRDAMEWSRLILEEESPLTGVGGHHAPSLLFPMEMLFEAFVAKHIGRKLGSPYTLKVQARAHHLVIHQKSAWFTLKPDLLVNEGTRSRVVLDTKWKLLDAGRKNGTEKYGLSQADFYQLQAYGLSYLNGVGDVVLVYPKTSTFQQPLPVFTFPKTEGLNLWVVPFCLDSKSLVYPEGSTIRSILGRVQVPV